MRILLEFGPEVLSPSERDSRLEEQLSEYFDVLAVGYFNFRDREFWRLHKEGLGELGCTILTTGDSRRPSSQSPSI